MIENFSQETNPIGLFSTFWKSEKEQLKWEGLIEPILRSKVYTPVGCWSINAGIYTLAFILRHPTAIAIAIAGI